MASMNEENTGKGAAEEEPEPEPDDASPSTVVASYHPTDNHKPHPDDNCDKPGAKKKCGRCGVEWYCDRNCQRVSLGWGR